MPAAAQPLRGVHRARPLSVLLACALHPLPWTLGWDSAACDRVLEVAWRPRVVEAELSAAAPTTMVAPRSAVTSVAASCASRCWLAIDSPALSAVCRERDNCPDFHDSLRGKGNVW